MAKDLSDLLSRLNERQRQVAQGWIAKYGAPSLHGSGWMRSAGSPARQAWVCEPLQGDDAAHFLSFLEPGVRVAILGAEHAAHDALKERLFEREVVGATGSGPCPGGILWGGSRERAWTPPGAGELPLVVSFYTVGNQYEAHAARLRESLCRQGIPHELTPVESKGRWEHNCSFKPRFILDCWRRHKRPVLWVDADATAHGRPELLAGTEADFAIAKLRGWQFASGTVFFNQTPAALRLLKTWVALAAARPEVWDQELLGEAWKRVHLETGLHTLWLPQSYTQIFDWPEDAEAGIPPVFVHHQASRAEEKLRGQSAPMLAEEEKAFRYSRPEGEAAFAAPTVFVPKPVLSFEDAVQLLGKGAEGAPFFIQVGAMDGKSFDPLYPEVVKGGWRGILIEPMPDLFERLRRNYAGVDGLVFLNCAVAERTGPVEMYRVPAELVDCGVVPEWALGISSLFLDRNALGGVRASEEEYARVRPFVQSLQVPGRTLADIVRDQGVQKIDLLQIDTEGFDYKVLLQVDTPVPSPTVLQLEHCNLPADERGAALRWLLGRGYDLRYDHKDVFGVRPELGGQGAQAAGAAG